MTAEEIRQRAQTIVPGLMSSASLGVRNNAQVIAAFQFEVSSEIAAQLAELNQNLSALRSENFKVNVNQVNP